MPAQCAHTHLHTLAGRSRMLPDDEWQKTHTYTMLMHCLPTVFICKSTALHTVHKLAHTCSIRCFTGSHPPTAYQAVFPLDREEGTVQWATGVEHKVSGSSTKFPSGSQLAACLQGRELHHTERRPAWSATSDLSARESAGGKERQTERKRESTLWSIVLCDSGWWNYGWTDWKILALWIDDCVTIMCVCACFFGASDK